MIGYSTFYQESLGLYPVPPQSVAEAVAHAKECLPNESCGVIADGEYYPLNNMHSDPEHNFRIDGAAYARIVASGKRIQAVMHSHPLGPSYPSYADMASQIAVGVPFGVVVFRGTEVIDTFFFGGDTPIAPYEGRPFKHGVFDCYALVKDWYRKERDIVLMPAAREHQWWNLQDRSKNYLEDNFSAAGFVEVDPLYAKTGDVLFFRLAHGGPVNHCGVYIESGKLLHHLYGTAKRPRLSLTENVYTWRKAMTHCLRYVGEP